MQSCILQQLIHQFHLCQWKEILLRLFQIDIRVGRLCICGNKLLEILKILL